MTVLIPDLTGCDLSGLFYGGDAGQKIGILLDGEPWIAKFPRTIKDMAGGHLPTYTSSPVSEYLGSKIYEMLGIDVHEVFLACLNGKVVCACRDFTFPDARLVEFKDLRNSISDDTSGFLEAASKGRGVFLNDVLASIEIIPALRQTPGVVDRFWQMFVVDALIENPDRDNGNWGLLRAADGSLSLAPVYDNGSSLFCKRSASLTEKRLKNADAIQQDAFGTNVSIYRLSDPERPEGKAIRPFEYMKTTENEHLDRAVCRIAQAIDLDLIDELVDSIPEVAYGETLLTAKQKESHKRLIRERCQNGLFPASKLACERQELRRRQLQSSRRSQSRSFPER